MESDFFNARRTALVVAHPGHELRIHGWLEHSRPTVFVLTDGSGSRGGSRLDSTARVLERAGAKAGAVFGSFSDRQFYDAVLSGDSSWLIARASTLLRALVDVQLVASDAQEGFNPAHDLCRHLVDAVVARLRGEGREIASFAFPLDAPPGGAGGEQIPARSIQWELSDDALLRKLEAARSYAGLEEEVRRALSSHGAAAFRREVFWPADDKPLVPSGPPAYETYGEQRRLTGVYGEVIRRRDHIDPLVAALRRFSDGADTGPETLAGADRTTLISTERV